MIRPRILFAVAALLGLAACSSVPPSAPPPIQQPDYGNALRLDVAGMEVVQAFDPRPWSPAEQAFAARMMDGMRTWSTARVRPVGATGTARVIVQNASVGERILRQQTGPLTMERVATYDGIISVRIEAIDRRTMRVGFSEATVRRQRTAPATTPPPERDWIWSEMATDMLGEMDAILGAEIQRRMPFLIVP